MKASRTTRRRLLGGLVPAFAAAVAWAADPPAAPVLALSDDGAYVINQAAKLVWSRCVEGMRWNGKTCAGEPLLADHAGAIALAIARGKSEAVRWRLPRVTELQRLVDKTASPPGPDPMLFPAAPRAWHWSGTASINIDAVNPYNYGNVVQHRTEENANHMAVLLGWAVSPVTGEARGDVSKRTRLPVRLVRPLE